MAIRHDCRRNDLPCTNCEAQEPRHGLGFIEALPRVAALLATDIRAALEGDPATKSPDEVIFCYPGLLATSSFAWPMNSMSQGADYSAHHDRIRP